MKPDRWHGEVRFHGRTLITTVGYPSETQAGRVAEDALAAKVVALFAVDESPDGDAA